MRTAVTDRGIEGGSVLAMMLLLRWHASVNHKDDTGRFLLDIGGSAVAIRTFDAT
jgi:hypothetical protein